MNEEDKTDWQIRDLDLTERSSNAGGWDVWAYLPRISLSVQRCWFTGCGLQDLGRAAVFHSSSHRELLRISMHIAAMRLARKKNCDQ
jgi:hypothetical protein